MENVARRLAATDVYNHLAPPIIYDVPLEVTAEERPQAQRAADTLTNGWYDEDVHDEECDWCYKRHPTDRYIYLCQCTFCDSYTHLEENCKKPHTHCVPEEVYKVTQNYRYSTHGPCPSHIPIWNF